MTPKPLNVLFLINSMALGGAENLVLNLVRKLDRGRFNPSVGWFYREEPLKEYKDLGIPLFYFPKTKRFDLGTMKSIAKAIKEKDIHIINAHHFLSLFYSFYGAKLANRAKLVLTAHSEEEIREIKGKWRIIGAHMLKRTDASVGVTEIVTKNIIEKFSLDGNKACTIRNGVDFNLFRQIQSESFDREKFGLKKEDIVIGNVANLRKNKNHLFLLKAFKELCSIYSDLKLVIVGKGYEEDPECSEPEIRRFILENSLEDKVFLLGFQPDIHNVLPLFDVFCLVSYKEGLPISLLEAMSVRLTVIGTDIVAIPALISNAKNGFLVHVGDVEDLKNKLKFLIENPEDRKHLGDLSRIEVMTNYSFEKCTQNYEELFHAIK